MDVASVVDFVGFGIHRKGGKRMTRVSFRKALLMSTYLICMVIRRMNFIESGLEGFRMPIRVWTWTLGAVSPHIHCSVGAAIQQVPE
jgi:hypothetical protein